jgi:hypothetical protein
MLALLVKHQVPWLRYRRRYRWHAFCANRHVSPGMLWQRRLDRLNRPCGQASCVQQSPEAEETGMIDAVSHLQSDCVWQRPHHDPLRLSRRANNRVLTLG